jgi:hypothetical protein
MFVIPFDSFEKGHYNNDCTFKCIGGLLKNDTFYETSIPNFELVT